MFASQGQGREEGQNQVRRGQAAPTGQRDRQEKYHTIADFWFEPI